MDDHQMKTFRAYITERLAIEDNPNAYTPPSTGGKRSRADLAFERRMARQYGGVMARIAARATAKAAHKAKPTRPPFKWYGTDYSVQAGWWHPTKQWITFREDYHVTQILKNPQAFGISSAELNAGLMKEAEHLVSRHVNWYDSEGTPNAHTAESVRKSILKLDIDLAYEVQRVAYMKGWLKVYSGNSRQTPMLEGINADSIRGAMREILESGGNFTTVAVERVGLNRGAVIFNRYNPNDWRSVS
jgi:hypothetical protein